MSKLLVVGHAAMDTVETRFGERVYLGGAGYHTAWSASLFLPKRRVLLKSVVGKDFDLGRLEEAGVDVSMVKVDENKKSDRHILCEIGEQRTYRKEGDLDEGVGLADLGDYNGEIGGVHLCSAPPEQQMEWLKQVREKFDSKVLVSSDNFETFVERSPELVREVARGSDLVFANEMEWRAIDDGTIKPRLVLKLGGRGAEYYEGGKRVLRVGVRRISGVRDTTGAGDVVAGIYLALSLRGWGKKEALGIACRVASWTVEDFGLEHIFGRDEFKQLLGDFGFQ